MKGKSKFIVVVSVLGVLLTLLSAQSVFAQTGSSTSGGTTIESSSTQASSPAPETYTGGSSTVVMPNTADLNRILDTVNLRPSVNNITVIQPAGPMPGTETSSNGMPIPRPLPSMSSSNPSPTMLTAGNVISASIKSFSNWFAELIRSIFNG